jgi:hypothetical protein
MLTDGGRVRDLHQVQDTDTDGGFVREPTRFRDPITAG